MNDVIAMTEGIDVNWYDENGLTALHIAASHGKDIVVEHLIAHKATIDKPDLQGWTPLMFAAIKGCATTVKLLISKGANIFCTNKIGADVLSVAVASGNRLTAEHIMERLPHDYECKVVTPLIPAFLAGHKAAGLSGAVTPMLEAKEKITLEAHFSAPVPNRQPVQLSYYSENHYHTGFGGTRSSPVVGNMQLSTANFRSRTSTHTYTPATSTYIPVNHMYTMSSSLSSPPCRYPVQEMDPPLCSSQRFQNKSVPNQSTKDSSGLNHHSLSPNFNQPLYKYDEIDDNLPSVSSPERISESPASTDTKGQQFSNFLTLQEPITKSHESLRDLLCKKNMKMQDTKPGNLTSSTTNRSPDISTKRQKITKNSFTEQNVEQRSTRSDQSPVTETALGHKTNYDTSRANNPYECFVRIQRMSPMKGDISPSTRHICKKKKSQ